MLGMDDSYPFREPVDPVALQIPDYLQIIKHPKDLGTIGAKIASGFYCSDPWMVGLGLGLGDAWDEGGWEGARVRGCMG